MLEYLTSYQTQCNLEELKKIKLEREQWKQRPVNKPLYEALYGLPHITDAQIDIEHSHVALKSSIITVEQRESIEQVAKTLIPWKKGPFNLFGMEIDAEWRSDLKWERIAPYIDNLENKRVLDIGCNNGYFLFKMAAQNPRLLLGIDPVIRCDTQFQMIQHFTQIPQLHFELFGVEHLNHFQNFFDTIFSMGIIYHHRHPLEQLIQMREALRPGGQLILETIGIPGEQSVCLFPEDRYAKMKNVWFVPTLSCFVHWCKRARFTDVEVIADTPLTAEEQRVTNWCPEGYQSLEDFLDPNDPSKTIEGHPAPRRFALVARKKHC